MNNEQNDKRLFNVQELSKYLGLSPYTIRRNARTGVFPFQAKRLGRLLMFDIRDVDRYIEGLPVVEK